MVRAGSSAVAVAAGHRAEVHRGARRRRRRLRARLHQIERVAERRLESNGLDAVDSSCRCEDRTGLHDDEIGHTRQRGDHLDRHVRELHDVRQPSQRSYGRITGLRLARASLDGQVVTDAAGNPRTVRRRPVRLRLRGDWLELGRLKHRRSVHDRAVKRRRSPTPTPTSGSTSRDGGSRGFCSDRSCRRCGRRSGADLARVDACHERRTPVLFREPQLPHHASAWTNQPPQNRGGHRGLHEAGTQRVLHSDPVGDNAFLEWRDDHQPLLLIAREQRDDVPRVPDLADPDAHLAEPNPPLRLEQLPDLRPGCVHQRLLLILDDPRAEPGSDAEPRIQVEAMDPIGWVRQPRSVSSGEHAVGQGVPASVQGRRQHRVRIARTFVVVGQVEQTREILLQRARHRIVPGLVYVRRRWRHRRRRA